MAQKGKGPESDVLLTFSEGLEEVSDPSPHSTGGNEHCTGTNETNKPSIKSDPSPNTIGGKEHGSCANKTDKPNINVNMATNQNVNAMKNNNIGEDEHGSGTKSTNNIGGSGADKTDKVPGANKTDKPNINDNTGANKNVNDIKAKKKCEANKQDYKWEARKG